MPAPVAEAKADVAAPPLPERIRRRLASPPSLRTLPARRYTARAAFLTLVRYLVSCTIRTLQITRREIREISFRMARSGGRGEGGADESLVRKVRSNVDCEYPYRVKIC